MKPRMNLVGTQFGALEVISEASPRKYLRYWNCKCSCGRVVEVCQTNLRSGHSTSCGCERDKALSERFTIDLTGHRFGRLVVLRRHGHTRGKTSWECKCDCGKAHITESYQLRQGMVKSCGCLRSYLSREDITGQRFGRLVAIRPTDQKHVSRSVVWEFKCDCGNVKFMPLHYAKVGHAASCGCAKTLGLVVRSDARRKRSRENVSHRLKTDVRFNLNNRVRCGISLVLKKRGGRKCKRTEEILGYSMKALEKHLRKTMPAGYTWDDYLARRLEIDHIIPLSVFNFTSEDDWDFKRAWAMKNLRLLPRPENRAKSDSLSAPFQPSLI